MPPNWAGSGLGREAPASEEAVRLPPQEIELQRIRKKARSRRLTKTGLRASAKHPAGTRKEKRRVHAQKQNRSSIPPHAQHNRDIVRSIAFFYRLCHNGGCMLGGLFCISR